MLGRCGIHLACGCCEISEMTPAQNERIARHAVKTPTCGLRFWASVLIKRNLSGEYRMQTGAECLPERCMTCSVTAN